MLEEKYFTDFKKLIDFLQKENSPFLIYFDGVIVTDNYKIYFREEAFNKINDLKKDMNSFLDKYFENFASIHNSSRTGCYVGNLEDLRIDKQGVRFTSDNTNITIPVSRYFHLYSFSADIIVNNDSLEVAKNINYDFYLTLLEIVKEEFETNQKTIDICKKKDKYCKDIIENLPDEEKLYLKIL